MNQIIKKYFRLSVKKEILLYLVFGGLTTVVDFLAYLAMMYTGSVTAATATAAAWLAAVLFAYVTNRRYVFCCRGNLLRFFGTRICSGLIQVLLMAALVDGLHLHKLVTKLAVGVLITGINYLGSKWLVFHKTEKEDSRQSITDYRTGRNEVAIWYTVPRETGSASMWRWRRACGMPCSDSIL